MLTGISCRDEIFKIRNVYISLLAVSLFRHLKTLATPIRKRSWSPRHVLRLLRLLACPNAASIWLRRQCTWLWLQNLVPRMLASAKRWTKCVTARFAPCPITCATAIVQGPKNTASTCTPIVMLRAMLSSGISPKAWSVGRFSRLGNEVGRGIALTPLYPIECNLHIRILGS